jgi:FtsH-binding integral membrane protein
VQDYDDAGRRAAFPTQVRDAREQFVSNVYGGLTLCLALAAGLSLIGAEWFKNNLPQSYQTWSILRWVPFGMLLIAMFVRFRGVVGWGFLLSFVAIQGFVIGPWLLVYGLGTAGLAFGITMGMFVGLTAYARWSGQNFSWMGGFLSLATVGLMVAGLAISFFGVSADAHLAFSFIGALVFSCWILYDTSAVLNEHYESNNLCGAILQLFVDFVNLFLFILRILGGRK